MQTKTLNTIQDFKEATDTNVAYELTALVKQIYRADSGLNIFTIGDGKDTLKCVAFTKTGVAYGEITEGSIATFQLKIKEYEGERQGTIQDADVTKDPEANLRLRQNILINEYSGYAPKKTELLLDLEEFRQLKGDMLRAATLIRGAIHKRRPILITHHGDCDGYAAGLLLERAITEQVKHVHADIRYMQNYILRNPSRTPYYSLGDVTKDISFFQLNQQRAGTSAPLILIVDNGSTEQDLLAIKKAQLFGADVMVIDHHDPGKKDENGKTAICRNTLAHVNPHLVGIDKNLSASMLCYQIAAYLDELNEPSTLIAAVGGVADKCEGNPIDHLVKQTKKTRAYLEELAKCIDFEIYNTKFNHSTGSLYELYDGPQQDALIDLYRPLMQQEEEKVAKTVQHFAKDTEHGAYHVVAVDGESTTLWGDYYSIGKVAAITHQTFTHDNQVTLVHSNNIIVFRVRQSKEHHFDVNELLDELTTSVDYARIDGGGHDVAGSIRFVAAAKEEILNFIYAYVARK